MTEIYLTPDLYIKKSITYYNDDTKNKTITVNANNWHRYLCEYGWEKLDYGWIRRLNRYKKEKEKNSRWGVLDCCGGNGDCLFSVIAETIGEPYSQTIRELAAKEITEENFLTILEIYRLAYDNDDFAHEWNPYQVKIIEDLQNELTKEGNNYWGDHIVLQLLEQALKINFIILNSEYESRGFIPLNKRFTIHSIGSEFYPDRKTIILYYIDSVHFQLVGHFTNTYMRTYFDQIPQELWTLYREDCRMR